MRRILSLLTVTMIVGAPLFGAQPIGGLDVYGNVWTNQAALPSGANVFSGDVVETDATGLAVLASARTGRVELRADSRAAFDSDALTLERGSAASAGLAVRIGEYEVAPRNEAADNWFVVAERDGERVVSAHRGDVVIARAGEAPVIVPAGSFALAAALPAPKEPAEAEQGSDAAQQAKNQTRRRTGRASNASGKSGWSIGSLGTTGSVAVVAGGVAAATTGLAYGLRDDSASPSN